MTLLLAFPVLVSRLVLDLVMDLAAILLEETGRTMEELGVECQRK